MRFPVPLFTAWLSSDVLVGPHSRPPCLSYSVSLAGYSATPGDVLLSLPKSPLIMVTPPGTSLWVPLPYSHLNTPHLSRFNPVLWLCLEWGGFKHQRASESRGSTAPPESGLGLRAWISNTSPAEAAAETVLGRPQLRPGRCFTPSFFSRDLFYQWLLLDTKTPQRLPTWCLFYPIRPRPGLQVLLALILGTNLQVFIDWWKLTFFFLFQQPKALVNHAPSRKLLGVAQREETLLNPKPARFSPLLLPRATHCPTHGFRQGF